jgi:hypothetical protein
MRSRVIKRPCIDCDVWDVKRMKSRTMERRRMTRNPTSKIRDPKKEEGRNPKKEEVPEVPETQKPKKPAKKTEDDDDNQKEKNKTKNDQISFYPAFFV